MIVVSEETKRGGDKINELRLQKNLSKLDIYIVELAADECYNEIEEAKISSSNHRIRLLGTRLQAPVSFLQNIQCNIIINHKIIISYLEFSLCIWMYKLIFCFFYYRG